MPVDEGDGLLGAVGTDPDHHQQADVVLLQADLEVDAVDPHVDVVGALERALVERGVNGHTDNLGSAAYGLSLSRQRAEAVAAALRAQLRGVQVMLRSRGFGEAGPVASNTTEAGRQRNRRVTIALPTV